jgi:hypothetical protein
MAVHSHRVRFGASSPPGALRERDAGSGLRAQPTAVAERVDLPVVLANVRSAMCGSRAVAEQLTALPERLFADGALHGSSRTSSPALADSSGNFTGQALTGTLVHKLIPEHAGESLPAFAVSWSRRRWSAPA